MAWLLNIPKKDERLPPTSFSQVRMASDRLDLATCLHLTSHGCQGHGALPQPGLVPGPPPDEVEIEEGVHTAATGAEEEGARARSLEGAANSANIASTRVLVLTRLLPASETTAVGEAGMVSLEVHLTLFP